MKQSTESIMVSIYSTRQRKLQTPLFLPLLCFVLICFFVEYRQHQTSQVTYEVVCALQFFVSFRIRPDRNRVFSSKRFLTRQSAKSTDGSDYDESPQSIPPGMAEAFRQLESLKSLDDPEEYIPAPDKINVDAALADTSTILTSTAATSSTISLEQDFALYRNMLEEIEVEESAVSYAEVLDELGDSALQTDDTYSQIMSELGGTKMKPTVALSPFSSWTKKTPAPDDVVPDVNPKSDGATLSNEQLLDDALKEALNEVQLNNPQLSERSILNDKEMMREIESIFDRGNAQLIESLEEIRRDQQALAESKSADAQNNSGLVVEESDTIKRLQNAEKSIQTILKRVDTETLNLEQAVDDLNAANRQIENDFLWKLKRGGLPKQAALAGLLLLSVRSILESFAALSSVSAIESEAHLYAALIQGVVAMVCAVIFFLL